MNKNQHRILQSRIYDITQTLQLNLSFSERERLLNLKRRLEEIREEELERTGWIVE
jgi:hypothetical protein